MTAIAIAVALLVTITGVLLLWQIRVRDEISDKQTGLALLKSIEPSDRYFESHMVRDLPEPAQRYFGYTIRPGTPLRQAVQIEMSGELSLGNPEKPNYRQMSAHQVLVPPFGFVWSVRSGMITGSDGLTPDTSWTRMRLWGLLPVVRAGGNEDHHRSAFGRMIAESAFWAPASLLPSEHVRWDPIDDSIARAIVTLGAMQQAVDISVSETGQPSSVLIQRWSNENAEKTFREQPFGGTLSGFENFDGFLLPTRVEGGNQFGTRDYFPFFKAVVRSIHFPKAGEG